MEKNNEEEKKPIDIEFNKQNVGFENNENDIDLRLSDVQEDDREDIAQANFFESLQK